MVFDYFCDMKSTPPDFRPWQEVVPSFQYRKEVPYFQMLVPTMDTYRFSYLLEVGGWENPRRGSSLGCLIV